MLSRLLAGILLALIVFGLSPDAIVLAHADLARAEPAPGSVLKQSPDRVIIWFTESVDPRFSEIRVLDAQGNQVDNGDSTTYQNDSTAISVTLPNLPDGVYTVAWHNVASADGHSLSGSFLFYIGESAVGLPQGPPTANEAGTGPILQSPAEPVLHWIELLSILAIVGSLVFELFITRPGILASGTGEALQVMAQQMGFRTFKLVLLAGGTFLLASAGELVVKTSVTHVIPWYLAIGHPAVSFAVQTGWGHLWLWRIGLLIGLFAVLAVVYPQQVRHRVAGWLDWRTITLVLAAGVLLTLSLVSHGAATTEIKAAGTFSDYIHLLAASFWVGGIIYLALVAPPGMKLFRQRGTGVNSSEPVSGMNNPSASVFCPSSHVMALRRFAALAVMSVGTLIITGLFNSWAQVTVLPALATPYGITLLIKLALIVPLLILGAINLWWVIPRLAHYGKALQVLHKTVFAQAVLAVVVLLSVGLLVSLEPARQAAPRLGIGPPQAITLKDTVDWAQIAVSVKPDRVGSNRFVVSVRDLKGNPVNDASSVGLFISYLNYDLGPYWQYAAPAGEGQYALESSLTVAGPWEVAIAVQRPGSFDVHTSLKFQVLLQGADVGATVPLSPGTGNLLWGVEVLLVGLLFLAVRRMTRRSKRDEMEPRRRLEDWHHMAIMCLVMVVVSGGLAYLFLHVDLIPGPASMERGLIDDFIKLLLAIASVVFGVIVTVFVYAVIFFRRQRGDDSDARPIRGNPALELTWTFIPLIIVVALGIYGAKVLDEMTATDPMYHTTQSIFSLGAMVPRDVAPSATTLPPELVVNVTASRFTWQFEYPDYNINSYVLEVPVNQRIRFNFQSKDVVHSFWVQQWGPKQDAVPGLNPVLRITPTEIGQYLVQCSQLCGYDHTDMTAPVRVVSAADFDTWVKQQQSSSSTPTSPPGSHVMIDLVAKNIAFDKSTITVSAGAEVMVNFDNQDSGIPHNFAVYTDSSATKSIFIGQIVTGPKTITYTFTAPTTPGNYFFRCDVHPTTMTGTFVVQ